MKQETIFGYPLEQLHIEAAAIFATHAVGEKVKDEAIKDKFKSVYNRHPDKLPIDKDCDLIVFKKIFYTIPDFIYFRFSKIICCNDHHY